MHSLFLSVSLLSSLPFSVSLFSHHSCPHPLSTTSPVHLAENESQQFKSCLHTPHTYPRPSMAQKLWKPGTTPVRRKQTCRTQCETCRESERMAGWGRARHLFAVYFSSFLFCFFFSCSSVEVPQNPGRRLSRLDRTSCRGSQQGDWSEMNQSDTRDRINTIQLRRSATGFYLLFGRSLLRDKKNQDLQCKRPLCLLLRNLTMPNLARRADSSVSILPCRIHNM